MRGLLDGSPEGARIVRLARRRLVERIVQEMTPRIGISRPVALLVPVAGGDPVTRKPSQIERHSPKRWVLAGVYDVTLPSFSVRQLEEDIAESRRVARGLA